MNIRELTQATRQNFPHADAVVIDIMPGKVRVTVALGGFHYALLKANRRVGTAFLDARRKHLLIDLLGMVFEVGYVA